MGRTRKSDKGLPARVYIRHGAYYFYDRAGRWHNLGRVTAGESAMYAAFSKIIEPGTRKGSMADALKRFRAVHLPTLTDSTRKEYERMYDVIAEGFAEFDVPQVQPRHVMQFLGNFQATPTARKHYKARLSTFFRWAVTEQGMRDTNPCAELRLKGPVRRKSAWNDELFWAVRDKLDDIMQCYHDLSILLYQRTTEIRLLMQSQRHGDVIRFVPTKTEHSSGLSIDVPVTPEIDAVWKRALSLCKLSAGPGGDAPVIQQADGSTYTRSGIYSAYRRADKALHGGKTTRLNPKALRPYAATVAKRLGYGIEQLQVALAHTSVTTTEGYVQKHETPLSEVSMRLPERLTK